jgi:hypothetical protein
MPYTELRTAIDKAGRRLEQVDAARIASIISALVAPPHHWQTGRAHAGKPRPEAPLPPRRLALLLVVSYQAMAQAFDLKGA